jgi:hypothetical protein
VLRVLDSGKCPRSCEECGGGSKEKLSPANLDAWDLYLVYPSLIRHGMDGSYVDYPSASRLADKEGIDDPLLERRLEAIRAGLKAKD